MIELTIALASLLVVGAILVRRRRAPARGGGAAGEVRLVDPRELLFSLPTIHDALPPAEPCALVDTAHAALVREDDWRQIEFLDVGNAVYVERTLAAIREHRVAHAVGIGFREVYVRSEPAVPLAEVGVTVEELARVLDAPRAELFLLGGAESRVIGGFAFEVSDLGFLYGYENGGRVSALGLGLVGGGLDPGAAAVLARVGERFDLLFVDWLGLRSFSATDTNALRAWLAAVTGDGPEAAT